MKTGSLLNPYATPFVPPSIQKANNENVAPTASKNNKTDDTTVQSKQVKDDETKATIFSCADSSSSYENPQHQLRNNATLQFNNPEIEGPTDSRELYCDIYGGENPMSHKTNDGIEKQSPIEDYELDLAYLAAAFPAVSEQSLLDVYCANAGDLEASADMLTQLEDDNILCLPQSLNTLDISETSTVDDSSRMQTTSHGKTSGSSSHPSNSALDSEPQ